MRMNDFNCNGTWIFLKLSYRLNKTIVIFKLKILIKSPFWINLLWPAAFHNSPFTAYKCFWDTVYCYCTAVMMFKISIYSVVQANKTAEGKRWEEVDVGSIGFPGMGGWHDLFSTVGLNGLSKENYLESRSFNFIETGTMGLPWCVCQTSRRNAPARCKCVWAMLLFFPFPLCLLPKWFALITRRTI